MRTTLFFIFAVAVAPIQGQDTHVLVSQYAPVKAVESQLLSFVEKIEKDLESKQDFGEESRLRVALDANTVAVLALALGKHDQDTSYRGRAAAIILCAQQLAAASDDFEQSQAKLKALQEAIVLDGAGAEVKWEPAAELSMLMKQVPIVNNLVRSGVTDKRRFERNAERTAQRAVTLAVIAQASSLDTSYCSGEEDEEEWKKICADMRTACADVYHALMAKDQVKANAANDRVVASCDACHHRFRD